MLPFVRLFYGNKLNLAVLTDFERGQKRKLENLHKAALLDHEHIILATEIAGKEEADIEDFFEPELFVDLINQIYQLQKEHQLTVEKLVAADTTTDRLVKKAEAFFQLLPDSIPDFSHFDPSIYLLQHPELLRDNADASNKTLNRFEVAFARIAKFLG